jgi:hypothetical protein
MDQGAILSYLHSGTHRRLFCLVVGLFVLGLCSAAVFPAQVAGSAATLTYIKVLKGSVPEYTSITVNSSGVGTYDGRELDESPRPRPLKLSPNTTQKLFRVAASLGDFHSISLESESKDVANMGQKTFIYRHDGRESRVQFNYTRDKRAVQLLKVFEGINTVEQDISTLEKSSRYDVLGLPSALTHVGVDLDSKTLVDPQLMVPILKKIAGDPQYLHIAQVRAQNLLRRIRDSKKSHKTRLF